LVADKVEEDGAVKAGDEEVCPGGPALHPRQAPAPAGGHEDAELPEEGGAGPFPRRPGYATDGPMYAGDRSATT